MFRNPLRFHRQLDGPRALFLAQRTAQFRERDVLQLTNPLAGHAEFLADFLQRLWLPAIEPEARKDDLPLPVIENVKQAAHFVAEILVAEQLERRLGLFVAD